MKKMLTKLKMSLTNNIGLKFLAVLIALVLWLAIVNVNDPEKTITVSNIPIIRYKRKCNNQQRYGI